MLVVGTEKSEQIHEMGFGYRADWYVRERAMLKMAEASNLGKWESMEEKDEAQEKELAEDRNLKCAI